MCASEIFTISTIEIKFAAAVNIWCNCKHTNYLLSLFTTICETWKMLYAFDMKKKFPYILYRSVLQFILFELLKTQFFLTKYMRTARLIEKWKHFFRVYIVCLPFIKVVVQMGEFEKRISYQFLWNALHFCLIMTMQVYILSRSCNVLYLH